MVARNFITVPGEQFIAEGTGAVERTVESKLQDTVSVKDFGATGDGVTDDSDFILEAFNYARLNPGTSIIFPSATYLISYGFIIPKQTKIFLNGSTIKATTTFAQGSIPTYGTNAFFAISNGASPLGASDVIDNISIIGDGALLDGRRDEQTGTIGGYTLIKLETSDTPVQSDLWKIKNITIKDLILDRSGYDGMYIAGADNVEVNNVTCNYALRIGFAGVAAKNTRFINCSANFTVGDNTDLPAAQRGPGNSGDGFWNEPNNSWQRIEISYVNCYASKNYQSGFKVWNAGADAETNIQLLGCTSYSDYWNEVTSALRSSPGGGYEINLNSTGAASFYISLKDCLVDTAARRGLSITRGAASGANYAQKIFIDNFTAVNCNLQDNSGINGAPIAIPTATGYPLIIITNPKIIAPSTNTQGYGIAVFNTTNVFVLNPSYAGVFSSATLYAGTYPAARISSNQPTTVVDPAYDDTVGGLTGNATKYFKPVRLSTWDQTASPSVADDLFANELAVWQDDSNQFVGIFKRDDSDTPKYLDFQGKKRLRAVFSAGAGFNIPPSGYVNISGTLTGAALGDIVQTSCTVDTKQCIVYGKINAANTYDVYIYNPNFSSSAVIAGCFIVVNSLSSDF